MRKGAEKTTAFLLSLVLCATSVIMPVYAQTGASFSSDSSSLGSAADSSAALPSNGEGYTEFNINNYLSAEPQDLTGKSWLSQYSLRAGGKNAALPQTVDNIAVFVNFKNSKPYATEQARALAEFSYNGTQDLNSLYAYVNALTYGNIKVKTSFFPKNGEIVLPEAIGYYTPKTEANAAGYATKAEKAQREAEMAAYIVNAVSEEFAASGKSYDSESLSFIFPTLTGKTEGVTTGELLWPHKALYAAGEVDTAQAALLNGEGLKAYNIVSAGSAQTGLMGSTGRSAGVIIHEFMHTLGLPDLSYGTSRTSGPVGIWDLTGGADILPAAVSAYYQREYAGFGTPLEVISAQGKASVELSFPKYISPDEKYAVIVKAPDNAFESFVFEARRQNVGTAAKPDIRDGLLAYRINTAFKASGGNKANSSFMYVMRPGESGYNAGDGSIADALIGSGSTFGMPIEEAGSAGKALYYADGTNSGLVIENVLIDGDKLSFDVIVPAAKAVNEEVPEGTNSEGTNSEGTNSEGTTSEGANSEGTNSEGANSEGTNSEGVNSEGNEITPPNAPQVSDGWSETTESYMLNGELLKNGVFELKFIGAMYLYAFDENGKRASAAIKIGDKEYYPTSENNFALAADEIISVDGKARYFDASGALAADGWVLLAADKGANGEFKAGSYYQRAGVLLTGKQVIQGSEYVFDNNARLIESEWSGDKNQYYLVNGERVTNQKRFIDGKYYIFNSNGDRMTGEFELTDPATGLKAKYCAPYESNNYALAQNEFVTLSVNIPLLGKILGEKIKYFDENCELRDGAITSYDGSQSGYPQGYYYQKNGAVLTGRQDIGEDIMFFGANGLRAESGWQGDSSEYFVKQGVALKSTVADCEWTDGEVYKYAFDENGVRLKGDFKLSDKSYYAPVQENNFALITDGFYLRDEKVIYFDENGAMPEGWFTIAADKGEYKAGTYYQSGYVFTGAQELAMPDGVTRLCFLDEKGRLVNGDEGWHTLPGGEYYLYGDGTFATGIALINEKLHGFDANGVLQTQRFEYTNEDGTYFYIPNAEKADEHYPLYKSVLLEYYKDGSDRFTAIDEQGRQVKDGWVKIDGKSYYQTDASYRALRGRKKIGDSYYIFDKACALADKPGFVDAPEGRFYMTGTDGIAVATGLVDISDKGLNKDYFPGALPQGELYCFDIYGLQYTGRFSMDGYQYITNENTEFGSVYRNVAIHNCECPKDSNGNIVHDGSVTAISASGRLIGSGFCFINGSSYYQVRTGLWDYKVKKGYAENLEGNSYYFDPATGSIQKGWHVAGDDIRYFAETLVGPRVGVEIKAPTFKVDNVYNVSNNTRTVTIKAEFGYLGADSAPYSFDGGKTWQSGSSITVACASGKSFKPGDIRVRGKKPSTPLPDELKSQWGERSVQKFITQNKDAVTLEPVIGSNRGIDVSSYQGVITPADWQKIRGSGISFAIIRGMSWPKGASYYQIDPQFEANVRNAKAAGIKVGVYLYSYAFNASEGVEEADFFANSAQLKRLRAEGIVFDLPVFIDYEDEKNVNNSDYTNRTAAVRTAMIRLEKVHGLYPGFYTYEAYMQYFGAAALAKEGYPFWYARYPKDPDLSRPPNTYGGAPVAIWQYSSKGSVSGVNGEVDMNILYDNSLLSKVQGFYGTSGTTPKPVEPKVTVYDTLTKANVTGTIQELLPRMVAGEVGGFAGTNSNLYKAQAVAANSWLMSQYASGVQAPQVALGNPSSELRKAVLEVAQFIMKYGGATANTAYSSCNNGKTASAKQLWGSDLPYLPAGITSSYDKTVSTWQSRKNTISNAQMATNLKKLFSEAEVNACNPSNYITSIQKDSNGYVTSVTVLNGSKTVAGGKFYDNTWGLYSPSFDMPRYTGNGWEFITYGNGHCVGMSQWGAYGMSLEGRLWSDILSHYYPGTQISVG